MIVDVDFGRARVPCGVALAPGRRVGTGVMVSLGGVANTGSVGVGVGAGVVA